MASEPTFRDQAAAAAVRARAQFGEWQRKMADRFTDIMDQGISIKAALAEMMGVAIFVFVGSAVAIYASWANGPNNESFKENSVLNGTIVAISFGISITVMIYMTAHNSGGHLNPAVTAGMVASGMMPMVQGIAHVIGQVLGGILAAIMLRIVIPVTVAKGQHLGANVLPEPTHFLSGVMAEAVGTFIVMLVILETVTHPKSGAGSLAALTIGLAFVVVIMAIAPISSASLNPARSIGPALLSGYFKHLWVFIIGPIAGALAAVPVHLLSVSDLDTTIYKYAANVAQEDAQAPLIPPGNPVSMVP